MPLITHYETWYLPSITQEPLPHGGKAQQPGTPLSDEEYSQFFRFLQTAGRANSACLLRMLYGCQYPLVQRLDEYENHGVIPQGKDNRDSQGQADGWVGIPHGQL
uniref:Acrosin-binding protein n=1 Tax=Melopsittacus undulatus TaxID=13146 RepID=A0A8C6JA63_MELUD